MNIDEKKLNKSIQMSYLIGLPTGIIFIIAVLVLPLIISGEGLFTLAILGGYGIPTLGLFVSFLVALGIGGRWVYGSLLKGNSLLSVSFMYSLIVNTIIWLTFILIVILLNKLEGLFMIIPPIIAFILCTILTTFSIGILVVKAIKRIIKHETHPTI